MTENRSMAKAYDVAIIGGGIAGLSSAYAFLQKRPRIKLTVFEAGPRAGEGASWANAGMIHPSQAWPWTQAGCGETAKRVARESFIIAQRSAELLRENFVRFGLEQRHINQGTMKIFRSAEDMDAQMAKLVPLAEYGLKMDFISPEALSLWPEFDRSQDQLFGAVYFPNEFSGPARIYCQKLIARIEAKGGAIFTEAPVQSLSQGQIKLASGQTVKAETIIIAAGTGSAALHPGLASIIGVKGYSRTFTLPDGVSLPRCCIMDHGQHLSIAPIGQHLRICGRSDPADSDDSDRHQELEAVLRRLLPQYAKYLDDALTSDWIGLRPMSPQGPIIGELSPGIYANTAHGHMGWTLSAGAAEQLAETVIG